MTHEHPVTALLPTSTTRIEEPRGADVPTAPGELLDGAVLDDLVELLGAPTTSSLLRKFAAQLETFHPAPCTTTQERSRLLGDAHAMTAVSGMLGFTKLSRCCAWLLSVRADGDLDRFAQAAAAVLDAKDGTVDRLRHRLAEHAAPAPAP